MNKLLIKFQFSSKNPISLFFIPGSSGGFSVPIIEKLQAYYSKYDVDILGINLDYTQDSIDVFDKSQEIIRQVTDTFAHEYPHKKSIIIAKSLGGSLALYQLNNLSVIGLIILGSSVVLGWPQRLSLLSEPDPQLPNYKSEWIPILKRVGKPVWIISGEKDDLTDNNFLESTVKDTSIITVTIVPNANHSLVDIDVGIPQTDFAIKAIDSLRVSNQ